MRQTLFRIRLDSLFSTNAIDGITAIGVGWLLLPWGLVGLWWLYRNKTDSENKTSLIGLLGFWATGSLVILLLPTIASNFSFQSLPVYGYGFMLFLGFLFAGLLGTRRAKEVGIEEEVIWDLAMWIFFAGIGGARLFYLVQYHERVFENKQGFELLKAIVNLPDGGLVFYGGAILAIAAYVVFCYRRKINALLLADVVTPSIFIGLMFGRMGCFLNGCCWGDRSDLPWAVSFPSQSVPFKALVQRGFLNPFEASTMPLHPSQLYSSFNAFVIFLLTYVFFRYRKKNGSVVAIAWIAYPITRFLIEFIRGDEMGKFNTSLTISQWISLCMVVSGITFALWLYWSPSPESHTVKKQPLSTSSV
ncbi:Prolipoprotein diacylglyceryl transferase [hydrothermal vent metagenome]|uniref:Prolipoprotein diacylglyceryl transferase n=1 Tax=hydrothermal vent metagenome TaxID=652676 RepID=A0A3B1E518_9ZZZZ